jgi:hypothetical protein
MRSARFASLFAFCFLLESLSAFAQVTSITTNQDVRGDIRLTGALTPASPGTATIGTATSPVGSISTTSTSIRDSSSFDHGSVVYSDCNDPADPDCGLGIATISSGTVGARMLLLTRGGTMHLPGNLNLGGSMNFLNQQASIGSAQSPVPTMYAMSYYSNQTDPQDADNILTTKKYVDDRVGANSNAWVNGGNNFPVPAEIGTLLNVPLRFKTAGEVWMTLRSNGAQTPLGVLDLTGDIYASDSVRAKHVHSEGSLSGGKLYLGAGTLFRTILEPGSNAGNFVLFLPPDNPQEGQTMRVLSTASAGGTTTTTLEWGRPYTTVLNEGVIIPAIAAGASADIDLEGENLPTNGPVVVSPLTDLPAGLVIAYARTNDDDNVVVRITNVSGSATVQATRDFRYSVFPH